MGRAPRLKPNPPIPAVCHRCGGRKLGPFVPCKACGHVPQGRGRSVAWLFSAHHLSAEELDEAARRIRGGDVPEPSRALLEHARTEMGALGPSPLIDRPLSRQTTLLLAACNILLTPLAGLAAWYGLRAHRPTAARQSLWVTLPAGALLAVGLIVDYWLQHPPRG